MTNYIDLEKIDIAKNPDLGNQKSPNDTGCQVVESVYIHNQLIPDYKITPVVKAMTEDELDALECDDEIFENEILPEIFKAFGVDPNEEPETVSVGLLRPAKDALPPLVRLSESLSPTKQKKEVTI